MLFITHDFGVVAEIADRVVVMQAAGWSSQGAAAQVLNAPQHPYTQALIAAVPHRAAPPPRPDRPVVLRTDRRAQVVLARRGVAGAAVARSRRCRTAISRCTRARRWGWSARVARANPRSRAASFG